MFSASKRRFEDKARQKIAGSIASRFREVFERPAQRDEEGQFRAIGEQVLTQIMFNQKHIGDLDECAAEVLGAALRHVFASRKPIKTFVYNAETVIDEHHRRGK